MKIKDLLKEIARCQQYYPDFLEWDIYAEQCTESDKAFKRNPCAPRDLKFETFEDETNAGYGQGWGVLHDSDDWEYFECAGFNTIFEKEKAFTINVNY